MFIIHIYAIYALFSQLIKASLQTIVWFSFIKLIAHLGWFVSGHRYWAHKSFRATKPLKCIMLLFNTLAVQQDIFKLCRDHRTHHKYSDTDADPHNATRGFLWCHYIWLVVRKSPLLKENAKTVHLDDLLKDKFVIFHRKYYFIMVLTLRVAFCTVVPCLFGRRKF